MLQIPATQYKMITKGREQGLVGCAKRKHTSQLHLSRNTAGRPDRPGGEKSLCKIEKFFAFPEAKRWTEDNIGHSYLPKMVSGKLLC